MLVRVFTLPFFISALIFLRCACFRKSLITSTASLSIKSALENIHQYRRIFRYFFEHLFLNEKDTWYHHAQQKKDVLKLLRNMKNKPTPIPIIIPIKVSKNNNDNSYY